MKLRVAQDQRRMSPIASRSGRARGQRLRDYAVYFLFGSSTDVFLASYSTLRK